MGETRMRRIGANFEQRRHDAAGRVVGGRGDQSFNDSAYKGVEKALRKYFGKRGDQVVQDNLTCIRRGYQEVFEVPRELIQDASLDGGKSWQARNQGIRAVFLPDKYPEFGQCVHKIAADAAVDGEVRRWQEAYLRDGHFDQRRMIELIQEVLREGKARSKVVLTV